MVEKSGFGKRTNRTFTLLHEKAKAPKDPGRVARNAKVVRVWAT